KEDNPDLDIHDIAAFFRHILERVDWRTDLHFQTCTTIDTLDYSGTGLNEGSKVVIAVAGPSRRTLPTTVPEMAWPTGFGVPDVGLTGVLGVKSPRFRPEAVDAERFCQAFRPMDPLGAFPLIVLVDDSAFTAQTLNNFLWVTFTRSNPAADIFGVCSFVRQ